MGKGNTEEPETQEHVRQRTVSNNPSVGEMSEMSDDEDRDQEKKLLRKLDWRIVPWIFILYFLSVEDRANVGYAMTMNAAEKHTLADTAGLTPQENNIGLGLFYVAYIVNIYMLIYRTFQFIVVG
jgi:hypothetical protein